MKNLLLEKLNTNIPSISHRLYDDNGNLVACNKQSLKIRGKVRIEGKDGSVLNCGNTTIYPGRRFILESLFRLLPNASQTIPINSAGYLNINADLTPASQDDYLKRSICLVGVGDGGAGLTFGEVYDAKANDNNLFHMIPMRTVPVGSDLSEADRAVYFMKKRNTHGSEQYYDYYLKKFEIPSINVVHENVNYTPSPDDNAPDMDPSNPLVLYNIQVYVAINIPISENDVKESYRADNGNIRMARFNEMALYFGLPIQVTDSVTQEQYTDYIITEAFSHLTFNNRAMDNEGSSYSFVYYLLS
jgi:hypothetical protein